MLFPYIHMPLRVEAQWRVSTQTHSCHVIFRAAGGFPSGSVSPWTSPPPTCQCFPNTPEHPSLPLFPHLLPEFISILSLLSPHGSVHPVPVYLRPLFHHFLSYTGMSNYSFPPFLSSFPLLLPTTICHLCVPCGASAVSHQHPSLSILSFPFPFKFKYEKGPSWECHRLFVTCLFDLLC